MDKKESIKFFVSVEGDVCEKLYFEHLSKLINSYPKRKYNAKIIAEKMSPTSFIKRYKSIFETRASFRPIYIHVQDIEDYYDNTQREKFYKLIDELGKIPKQFPRKMDSYRLAYSNFTFELWMILNKQDLFFAVASRDKYLPHIEKAFSKKFTCLKDYKTEKEFANILESITMDDVFSAIKRSRQIRDNHKSDHLETYGKFGFYRDNPDLSIHTEVENILKKCGITCP